MKFIFAFHFCGSVLLIDNLPTKRGMVVHFYTSYKDMRQFMADDTGDMEKVEPNLLVGEELGTGSMCHKHVETNTTFTCSVNFNPPDDDFPKGCNEGLSSYNACVEPNICKNEYSCTTNIFQCELFTCDGEAGYTCRKESIDYICSDEYLCKTDFICSGGHVYMCLDTDNCTSFTCSSPGNPSCDGTPGNQYDMSAAGDFVCGGFAKSSDFNCKESFLCKSSDQFECGKNTDFTCKSGNVECDAKTHYNCRTTVNCSGPTSYTCQFSGPPPWARSSPMSSSDSAESKSWHGEESTLPSLKDLLGE